MTSSGLTSKNVKNKKTEIEITKNGICSEVTPEKFPMPQIANVFTESALEKKLRNEIADDEI
jgi:hypothetical protein